MTDSMGPKLRALLSESEREGPGRGYPRHLREEAARYVLSRRAQGASFEQIARTLAVPYPVSDPHTGSNRGALAQRPSMWLSPPVALRRRVRRRLVRARRTALA